MKFALLHLDQAVELLLKERVRMFGQSIYKPGGKETISIWAAHEALAKLNCKIPEKADLELLHEERNSIQHKYANPSPEDAEFHFEKALTFILRFSKDELKVNVRDFVPSSFIDEVLPP